MRLSSFLVWYIVIGMIFLTTDAYCGSDQLRVTIDPRIELLAVVQSLGGFDSSIGLVTRFDFDYKRDVGSYFGRFRNHRAVKLLDEMGPAGFSFDAPPTVMLYYSPPPDLRSQIPVPADISKRAGGSDRLDEAIGALREFCRETNFVGFFEAHKQWYDRVITNATDSIRGDYIQTLESYYGMKQHSFNIILAPLFTGGFGPRVKIGPDQYDIYNITSPIMMKDGLPVFGTQETFGHMCYHEFSHSFVNPTTERFGAEIDKSESLMDPVADRMRKLAYGEWRTCVNEHIVRAVTTRLAFRESGPAAGNRAMKIERSRGFFYLPMLCGKLEEYEKERAKYATFVDFYPELVSVFDQLASEHLPKSFYLLAFDGPINAATTDQKSMVYIVPTHESDRAAQDSLTKYAGRVKARFAAEAPLLTDEEALRQDLSSNTIVVYGTIEGNSWLAQHRSLFPAQIRPDRIVADFTYPGEHLRFITALRNPGDSTKAIIIYTAQTTSDIVGINGVMHGSTDFVISSGTAILKAGDYVKKDSVWSFH